MNDKINTNVNVKNNLKKYANGIKSNINTTINKINNVTTETIELDDIKDVNDYSAEDILKIIPPSGEIDIDCIDFNKIASSSSDALDKKFIDKSRVYSKYWGDNGKLTYEILDNGAVLIKEADVGLGFTTIDGISKIITGVEPAKKKNFTEYVKLPNMNFKDLLKRKNSDIDVVFSDISPFKEYDRVETFDDGSYKVYNGLNNLICEYNADGSYVLYDNSKRKISERDSAGNEKKYNVQGDIIDELNKVYLDDGGYEEIKNGKCIKKVYADGSYEEFENNDVVKRGKSDGSYQELNNGQIIKNVYADGSYYIYEEGHYPNPKLIYSSKSDSFIACGYDETSGKYGARNLGSTYIIRDADGNVTKELKGDGSSKSYSYYQGEISTYVFTDANGHSVFYNSDGIKNCEMWHDDTFDSDVTVYYYNGKISNIYGLYGRDEIRIRDDGTVREFFGNGSEVIY